MLSSRLKNTCLLKIKYLKRYPSSLIITRGRSGITDVNDKASGSKEPGSSQESVNLDSKKDTAKGAKTMAELDNELRERLENTSGEGGVAGLEYENGKPVAMRRSVRNNMFRYI